MDSDIRALLIERAILQAPVTYDTIMQQLGLDHHKDLHRDRLSEELEMISQWENSQGRPLLSAMAVYTKDRTVGEKFYELAALLGFGDAKMLKKQQFSKTTQEACTLFWRNPVNNKYRQHITGEIISTDAQPAGAPPFFSQTELTFFGKWANQVYRKDDPSHAIIKDRIREELIPKVVYWAEQLVQRIDGLDCHLSTGWLQPGWDGAPGEREQVSKFKHYCWSRLFRAKDKGREIFFTIEANGQELSLVYKLHYLFTDNSVLSAAQQLLCEQLIPDELTWIVIPFERLPQYNWELLLAETENFIRDNLPVYDDIIASVWSGHIHVAKLRNRLIKRDGDGDGVSSIPARHPSFAGHQTDWEKRFQENQAVGIMGEELVIAYEKECLEKSAPALVEKVVKMPDGRGFDIQSWFPDGRPKDIEVKTTTGDKHTAFPISINEVFYSAKYPAQYYLYRVFNLDPENNVAEFQEYPGDITTHFLLESEAFLAHKLRQDM